MIGKNIGETKVQGNRGKAKEELDVGYQRVYEIMLL